MNACLTLGRGRVSFHSDDKHMYLGSRRMEVLKEVCKTSIDVGGLLWPLWIPPSHRWIVASNLTSEEIQSNCLDAELFIVNGALMSIGEVLKSFATWSFREPSSEHTMVSSAYDEVLLSLDNARLILGAFSRLDKDNRRDSFAKLIEIVCPWIESISERPNDLIRLKDDFEASGFVSRVVTLCANAYSLMRFGSSVRRELVELIGSSQTSSALFVRRNRQYSAEKSFMGVLGNWEFSDDVSSRLLLQDVDPRAEESMKQILEAAFRLGFLSGQTDRGHLLFSAWNGLGKSDLWHIKNEVVPLPQGFVMEASNTPSVILELRDDLCLVSRLLRKLNFKASSVPPLIAAIDGRMKSEFRNKAELSLKIGQCLLAMISKASTLVEIVLDINDSASLSAAPPQIQCLLHTISTYVCFVASSCTRPKTDFFSNFSAIYHRSSHKRKRGNSTDSEASDSDEEATEVENDEALHLLKSLEDICSKIGASPAYPDWLDAECSLLDRINPDMALDIAEKAQKCLCSLVTVCVREIKALQNVVLSDQSSFSPAIDVPMPIVELCWVDQFWDVTPSVSGRRAHISAEDSGSLYDSVSRHLRIESDDLRFAAEILTTKVQDCQAMRWFKCASQRVQGKLSDLFRGNSLGEVDVSTPVLRAGCEWEMLLARGLTPACLGLDKVSRASTSARLPFLEALRWNDVLSGAVDCFVPVVALVHFGLHKGGRPICPLRSSEMHIDLLQRNYEYFKGSLFNVNASVSLKESVHETLAVLAILPLTRSLSASASQLCTSEDTFPRLRSFASLTKALNILGELQALTTVENHHEQDLLCRTIVDRLALIMENAKSDQQSSTYAISRETLLSAFSVMKFPKAKTILGVDFDTAFVTRVLRRTYYCSGSYTNHILKDEKFGSLRCLTSFIWSNTKLASCRSRILFVEMFYEVIRSLPEEDDDENGPLSPVLGILNNCEDDALRRLLVEDICFRPEKEDGNEPSRKLQGCLCSLFSIILCKGVRASRCKKSGVIAKTLLESIQIWWGEPRLARVQILNLLLLHSTVSRELHLVGRAFLASYEENKRPLSIDVEDLCYISNFVSSLQSSLTDKENETRGGQQDKVLALLPPVCTYIAYSDFHEQHWCKFDLHVS